MKRVDRYIGATVASATLLAWLAIVVLEALFVLLGQIADIGRGDYGFADALLFVALGVPTRAWQAFPMAALIGVVLGLGNLAAQFELDAFRLAGCSPQRLTRAVGKAKAMEMCLTGRMMNADEAERAGLVAQVVANDQLLEVALASANQIAGYSRVAVYLAKESVNQAFETTLLEGLRFEKRLFHATFATADQKEGMQAFVDKREPNFENR